jgi:pilus assembly protein CpaE
VGPTVSSAGQARTVAAVAIPGLSREFLNDVLGPRGFAPPQMVASSAELVKLIRTASPDLVLVPVPPAGGSDEFSLVEAELRRHPSTLAIGVSSAKDADTVLAAMRAGIMEFLVTPLQANELVGAVQRLSAVWVGSSQLGRIIAVHSAKGGLGSSSLAIMIAWALAHKKGSLNVALADFTTTGAGLRVLLDMNPAYDIGNILTRTGELDREFLRSCMAPHAEGVSVLAAAEDLQNIDSLTSATAGRVIELLRKDFDYSVIDTDHAFSDQSLAALDVADRIVLITHGDIASVRSTQRSLTLFDRLGYPREKLLVVMNKRADDDRISRRDAAKVLDRGVDFVIPEDKTLLLDAITYGQFPQQRAPRSPIAVALEQLADALMNNGNGGGDAGLDEPGGKSASRMARLFRRGTS